MFNDAAAAAAAATAELLLPTGDVDIVDDNWWFVKNIPEPELAFDTAFDVAADEANEWLSCDPERWPGCPVAGDEAKWWPECAWSVKLEWPVALPLALPPPPCPDAEPLDGGGDGGVITPPKLLAVSKLDAWTLLPLRLEVPVKLTNEPTALADPVSKLVEDIMNDELLPGVAISVDINRCN